MEWSHAVIILSHREQVPRSAVTHYKVSWVSLSLSSMTYKMFWLEALSSMCKLKLLQKQQGEKRLWWHLNWRYSGRETNLVVTWEMNGTGGRGDRRTGKGKREEEMMIKNDVEEWKRRPTKIKSKSGGSRKNKGERGRRRKREREKKKKNIYIYM